MLIGVIQGRVGLDISDLELLSDGTDHHDEFFFQMITHETLKLGLRYQTCYLV